MPPCAQPDVSQPCEPFDRAGRREIGTGRTEPDDDDRRAVAGPGHSPKTFGDGSGDAPSGLWTTLFASVVP